MSRLADAAADDQTPATKKLVLGKIADLLERSGIDIEEVGHIHRVNVWQAMHRDDAGDAVVTDLAGIQLTPKWADGPEWPVVAPARPSVIRPAKGVRRRQAPPGWETCAVLPDIQSGYYRDRNDVLQATHDERALDVALQVVRAARPDLVVFVGDNADFPELSKYRLSPAFQRTTQPTIDRCGRLAAEARAAAPEARIVWLAGNHEERLPNYIIDNARAAFGLRRANTPESWPVLSMPDLCRFSDHAVDFIPGYPANGHFINRRLRVIHGDLAPKGSAAHAYLARERVSVIYGHIHRREWAERTRITEDGARTILAASPGCLCRTDGRVPSTHQGWDADGIPMERIEDWQQGLALVHYEPGDGRFRYEPVPIFDGWAEWRGHTYEAGA